MILLLVWIICAMFSYFAACVLEGNKQYFDKGATIATIFMIVLGPIGAFIALLILFGEGKIKIKLPPFPCFPNILYKKSTDE